MGTSTFLSQLHGILDPTTGTFGLSTLIFFGEHPTLDAATSMRKSTVVVLINLILS
jgi:hypothetical protein